MLALYAFSLGKILGLTNFLKNEKSGHSCLESSEKTKKNEKF